MVLRLSYSFQRFTRVFIIQIFSVFLRNLGKKLGNRFDGFHCRSVLVKAKREDLIKDLDEKKELAGTRSTVLAKQEQRVRENIKELQAKIEDAIKGRGTSGQPAAN